MIAALSLGFIVTSFKIVPAALLRRDLAFRRLAIIDASGSAILSLTMILLALGGLGVWTLVFGTLASQAFSTFVILRLRRIGFRAPRRSELGTALTFKGHQLSGNLLWYTYTSADFVVAGKTLGEKVAGIYYFAWTLSKTIPEKITGLIVNVAPSYFSAVQDDARELRRYLLRLTEAIALVTFPALVGMALLATEVEVHVLGPRWRGLSWPLRVLAVYAALTSVTPLLSRILTVRRQTRFLVRTGALMTATLVPGFWAGSHWGAAELASRIARVVAEELGVPEEVVTDALAQLRPPKSRLNRLRAGELHVIDDSYTNPMSMTLGLDTLRSDAAAGSRKVAVLGTMAELGEDAERYQKRSDATRARPPTSSSASESWAGSTAPTTGSRTARRAPSASTRSSHPETRSS